MQSSFSVTSLVAFENIDLNTSVEHLTKKEISLRSINQGRQKTMQQKSNKIILEPLIDGGGGNGKGGNNSNSNNSNNSNNKKCGNKRFILGMGGMGQVQTAGGTGTKNGSTQYHRDVGKSVDGRQMSGFNTEKLKFSEDTTSASYPHTTPPVEKSPPLPPGDKPHTYNRFFGNTFNGKFYVPNPKKVQLCPIYNEKGSVPNHPHPNHPNHIHSVKTTNRKIPGSLCIDGGQLMAKSSVPVNSMMGKPNRSKGKPQNPKIVSLKNQMVYNKKMQKISSSSITYTIQFKLQKVAKVKIIQSAWRKHHERKLTAIQKISRTVKGFLEFRRVQKSLRHAWGVGVISHRIYIYIKIKRSRVTTPLMPPSYYLKSKIYSRILKLQSVFRGFLTREKIKGVARGSKWRARRRVWLVSQKLRFRIATLGSERMEREISSNLQCEINQINKYVLHQCRNLGNRQEGYVVRLERDMKENFKYNSWRELEGERCWIHAETLIKINENPLGFCLRKNMEDLQQVAGSCWLAFLTPWTSQISILLMKGIEYTSGLQISTRRNRIKLIN